PGEGEPLAAEADDESLPGPPAEELLKRLDRGRVARARARREPGLDRNEGLAVLDHEIHLLARSGPPEVQPARQTTVYEQAMELAHDGRLESRPRRHPDEELIGVGHTEEVGERARVEEIDFGPFHE